MNDLFGSPLSIEDSFKRYMSIAPIEMPDGSIVENPNITVARQESQQSTQPGKSKTILYVMMAGAVILAGVLIFIILKRK